MGRRRNLFPSLGIPCSRLGWRVYQLINCTGNIQSSSLDSSIHHRA